LSRGEDGEEKCRRGLASVARGRDDAQRALSDPPATTFVAERRAPASAPNDLSCRAASIRDRPGSHDEKDSRPIVERIVHRDQSIGIDDDFLGELLRVERGVQCAALLIPPRPGDAAVENARKHNAGLRYLSEGARYQFRDDVG